MQNLPLDFAMLKDEAGRDSNMETDERVKRGERTKWLALGDRESGLLGIGRSLPVLGIECQSGSDAAFLGFGIDPLLKRDRVSAGR
jgi:hypothetical protein